MNDIGRQWNAKILHPLARGEQVAFAHRLVSAMDGLPFARPHSPIPLRPVVLSSAAYEGVSSVARRLVRLVTDVCRRRAADPRALAAALDYPPERLRLIPPLPGGSEWSASMARPDVVFSGGIPKILECNVHSAIGGVVEASRTAGLYLSSPAGARLRAAGALWADSPLAARRNLLDRAARASGGGRRPQVAVIGRVSNDDDDAFPGYLVGEVDYLCAHGLPATLLGPADLDIGNDGFLCLGARRFHVALRFFITADWVTRSIDLSALEGVLRAGRTALMVDDVASLYSSKAVLAWLWEATDLSEAERRFVRRHIPWTVAVADRAVEVDGRRVELLSFLETERAGFVLKPFAGRRGKHVTVGRLLSGGAWREALEEAVRNGRTVAQRYVVPDTAPIPFCTPEGEIEVRRVPLLFGPFVFGREPAGCLVSHLTAFTEGMVNLASGAVLTTAVACGPHHGRGGRPALTHEPR